MLNMEDIVANLTPDERKQVVAEYNVYLGTKNPDRISLLYRITMKYINSLPNMYVSTIEEHLQYTAELAAK